MILEEILRFTIPGYTVVFAFLIATWPILQEIESAVLAAGVAIAGLPVGYVIHQLYMFLYERCGYAQRPHLKLIIKRYNKRYKKSSEEGPNERQALLAWDYWLFHGYKKSDEAYRAHLIRFSYWWHSFRSMLVASIASLMILFAVLVRSLVLVGCVHCWTLIVTVFYCLLAAFFCLKSKQTEQFLYPLMRVAVIQNWSDMERVLSEILRDQDDIWPESRSDEERR